jgi:hypothetical protein
VDKQQKSGQDQGFSLKVQNDTIMGHAPGVKVLQLLPAIKSGAVVRTAVTMLSCLHACRSKKHACTKTRSTQQQEPALYMQTADPLQAKDQSCDTCNSSLHKTFRHYCLGLHPLQTPLPSLLPKLLSSIRQQHMPALQQSSQASLDGLLR